MLAPGRRPQTLAMWKSPSCSWRVLMAGQLASLKTTGPGEDKAEATMFFMAWPWKSNSVISALCSWLRRPPPVRVGEDHSGGKAHRGPAGAAYHTGNSLVRLQLPICHCCPSLPFPRGFGSSLPQKRPVTWAVLYVLRSGLPGH